VCLRKETLKGDLATSRHGLYSPLSISFNTTIHFFPIKAFRLLLYNSLIIYIDFIRIYIYIYIICFPSLLVCDS
jgi:hypothetical protein